jgi:hypothetical protein
MKRISTWVLAVLLPAVLSAQSWVARYNGTAGINSNDRPAGMAADGTGNVYVTGSGTGAGSGQDFLTLKYSSVGTLLWSSRYTSSGSFTDEASAIVYDPAGYVYVAGYTASADTDFLTVKYSSATGDTLWTRRYNGPAGRRDQAVALALDDSGNVYVAGNARKGSHSAAGVVKYARDGRQCWAANIDLPVGDSSASASAVVVDAARNAYVCGTVRDNHSQTDFLVAKLLPLNGDTAWVRTYDGTGNDADYATALAVDGTGNVHVTGSSRSGANGYDYLTLKYNSSGMVQWERRYDGADHTFDSSAAVVLDPAGNVYVTGQSYGSSSNNEDIVTVKYDAAGTQKWANRYNSSPNRPDIARALCWVPGGYVTATGSSENSQNIDIITIQYDTSTGTRLWTNRYNSPFDDDEEGVAVYMPDANSFCVTGYSFGDSLWDYVTLRYIAHDLGVTDMNAPVGSLPPQPVVPSVDVTNFGIVTETAAVHLWIAKTGNPASYYDVQTLAGIAAGATETVDWFRYFTGDMGSYTVKCSVALASDMNPGNNRRDTTFTFVWTTPPSWALISYVPPGPRSKGVKDGGSMCFGSYPGTAGYLYMLKGNNTPEFYRFNCSGDTFEYRGLQETIPYNPYARKKPKKGAALCYDRYDTLVYAVKGNNTTEFWKFNVPARIWSWVRDVPLGYGGKKVKGGASLALWHEATGTDWVYCMKGSKTWELWRYHAQADTWQSRNMMPTGLSGKGFGDGSCMVNAGGTFYILKGSYNELYAYYPNGDSYQLRKPLPMYGSSGKKKKAKDGTAMCYRSAGGVRTIYLVKGGTDEFWTYYPAADTWIQQISIPASGSAVVKSGGALAYGDGTVWALKGNKTWDLWGYDPGADFVGNAPLPQALTDRLAGRSRPGLTVIPNPLRAVALVGLPAGADAGQLTLHDAAGRLVRTHAVPTGTQHVALERRGLPAGIYILRWQSGTDRAEQKLIVQ